MDRKWRLCFRLGRLYIYTALVRGERFLLIGCSPSLAVEDWDLFESVLRHCYTKHLKSESEMHPVMMAEPAVSSAPSNVPSLDSLHRYISPS